MNCAGIDSLDKDDIVFLRFRSYAEGELECMKIPVREMQRAAA